MPWRSSIQVCRRRLGRQRQAHLDVPGKAVVLWTWSFNSSVRTDGAKISHRDWKHSAPLPLSDEALIADLADRDQRRVERLALREFDANEW